MFSFFCFSQFLTPPPNMTFLDRGHGSPINDGSHDHLETGETGQGGRGGQRRCEADTWRIIPGLVSG